MDHVRKPKNWIETIWEENCTYLVSKLIDICITKTISIIYLISTIIHFIDVLVSHPIVPQSWTEISSPSLNVFALLAICSVFHCIFRIWYDLHKKLRACRVTLVFTSNCCFSEKMLDVITEIMRDSLANEATLPHPWVH